MNIVRCGYYGYCIPELIELKEKVSTNEVSIYFFWRDTDKIKSAKHDRHEVARQF